MKTANNADGTLRTAEAGKQWEEVLSGAQGTFIVPDYTTFRVRATGATTVTIDGILAMTMSAGEIEKFCVGRGSPNRLPGFGITVVIGGANAFVQVARNQDRTTDGQPGTL